MTKTLTYFNYIGVHPDGNLVQSKCECVAGDGSAAVVCYAIAHFNETGKWLIRETLTQKTQMWHAPKIARLNESPKKVEDLTPAVQKQGSEKPENVDLCFDPRKKPSTPVDHNARARAAVISYTNHTLLGISTIYQVASNKAIIKYHNYLKASLHQQLVFNRMKVSEGFRNTGVLIRSSAFMSWSVFS